MRTWESAKGYTVIEVMVVLAVSGALFISTALLLEGRQAQNLSNQALREFDAQIQNVANEVSSGFFPNGFTCVANPVTVSVTNVVANPGENQGCIFLGKILNFQTYKLDTITVVGRQYVGSTRRDIANLTEATPAVVANGLVNLTQTYWYSDASVLELESIESIEDDSSIRSLGFMAELGGGANSGPTNSGSGSRGVKLYAIPGPVLGNSTPPELVDPNALIPLPNGARVCLKTDDGRKASINVGVGNNQNSTELLIDDGASNEC